MLGFGAIGEAPIGAGASGSLVIRKEIEKPQNIRSDGSVDETMPVTTADAAPDDHDPSPTRAAPQQQRGVVVAQFCACRQTKKAGYPLSKNTGHKSASALTVGSRPVEAENQHRVRNISPTGEIADPDRTEHVCLTGSSDLNLSASVIYVALTS